MKINMERDSFLWSEVRLVIAAVALFLGGVPVVYVILPIPVLYGLIHTLLILAWLISGVASCYLLYGWYKNGMKLFGKKETWDTVAFFVAAISGINLGLAGLFGRNIGMSIVAGRSVFVIVGLIYLATAWYLYQRWSASGKKLL
jgi:hypothetical protein